MYAIGKRPTRYATRKCPASWYATRCLHAPAVATGAARALLLTPQPWNAQSSAGAAASGVWRRGAPVARLHIAPERVEHERGAAAAVLHLVEAEREDGG